LNSVGTNFPNRYKFAARLTWEAVFADLQVGSVVTVQHLGMRNETHECPFRDEPYSGERGGYPKSQVLVGQPRSQ
jgi:hypothetical protein